MITVTLLVVSLLANGILAYLLRESKSQWKDANAKFVSTKMFADDAAVKISKLEQENKSLSNTVVLLKASAEVATKQNSNGQQPRTNKPFKKRGPKGPKNN